LFNRETIEVVEIELSKRAFPAIEHCHFCLNTLLYVPFVICAAQILIRRVRLSARAVRIHHHGNLMHASSAIQAQEHVYSRSAKRIKLGQRHRCSRHRNVLRYCAMFW